MAADFQAQGHPQVAHSGLQGFQVLRDQGVEVFFGPPAEREARVGHHQTGPHGPAQFQAVLQGGPGLAGLLLVVGSETGEVGGVDGDGDAPLPGQCAEAGAALAPSRETPS